MTDEEHIAAILAAGMLARGDRPVGGSGGDMQREANNAAAIYERVKAALEVNKAGRRDTAPL